MKDGGPAFPTFTAPGSRESYAAGGCVPLGGMSLRDYFAAKALNGLVANGALPTDKKRVAQVAYEYADAMLDERDKSEARQGGYGG